MIRALLFLALAAFANAATYYVRTDGSNSNSGLTNSAGGAWLTIAFAESQIAAGDIVRVQTGAYNERTTISPGGSAGNYKTFIADGAVVCRGFSISASSYIRVIGFEITHTSTTYLHGISISGVSSYIEILDNYIHNTYRHGITAQTFSSTSYVTVRGNTIAQTGYIPGVVNEDTWAAVTSTYIKPDGSQGLAADHWLVEYNTVIDCIDVFLVFGAYNIFRNNYVPRGRNPTDGITHPDVWQAGSDGAVTGSAHGLVEANLVGRMSDLDAHFGLWQDTNHPGGLPAGDTDFVIRGNVGFEFGSGGIGTICSTYVSTYNNTFYKLVQTASSGAVLIWFKKSTDTLYPDYPVGINTIIANDGFGTDAIYVQPGTTGAWLANNLGYQAGSEASYVSTADPQFTDAANLDFRIQAGSPAINAGAAPVTITSATGSGTSFDVDRPLLLRDGYGIVSGDTVTIGATTTTITGISGSTVTVAASVSWTQNDPLYWGTDTTPDIGALPYGSTRLVSATLSQNVTTYTVVTSGDARGVWFYVDGIPTTWDGSAPFSAVIASGTVTARAYALYAQTNQVVPDRWNTQSGGMSGTATISGKATLQ